MRRHRHLMIEVHVDVEVTLAAGESGGDQAVLQPLARRYVYAPVVQVRASPSLGGEHLLPRRIEDDSGQHLARALYRQRDVEDGKAVSEVGGAVQRVDEPAIFGRTFVPAALFGDDAM